VPFDYTVEFAADKPKQKADELLRESKYVAMTDNIANRPGATVQERPVVGRAVIDGATYDWTGILSANDFNIQFTGTRYEGHLELKRVREEKLTP